MSMSKKIRQLLIEKDINVAKLAELLNTTPQNLSNKLMRDNFSEQDLQKIASALNCRFDAKFIIEDELGNKIKEI